MGNGGDVGELEQEWWGQGSLFLLSHVMRDPGGGHRGSEDLPIVWVLVLGGMDTTCAVHVRTEMGAQVIPGSLQGLSLCPATMGPGQSMDITTGKRNAHQS